MLGFKHDDLVDTTVYGGTHTKAGISFEFYDFIIGNTSKSMNNSATNSGGWAVTQMRKDLNGYNNNDAVQSGTIGGLGTNLNNRSYIKQVKKNYIAIYNDANSVTTCNDYLWILSCSEVWSKGRSDLSSTKYGTAIGKEGNQYKWYKDNENGIDPSASNSNFINKSPLSGNTNWWWLRSPIYDGNVYFCGVNSNGSSTAGSASGTGGVAPGFCI